MGVKGKRRYFFSFCLFHTAKDTHGTYYHEIYKRRIENSTQKVFEIMLKTILIQSSTTTLDVIFRFVNDLHARKWFNSIGVEHETVSLNCVHCHLFILSRLTTLISLDVSNMVCSRTSRSRVETTFLFRSACVYVNICHCVTEHDKAYLKSLWFL